MGVTIVVVLLLYLLVQLLSYLVWLLLVLVSASMCLWHYELVCAEVRILTLVRNYDYRSRVGSVIPCQQVALVCSSTSGLDMPPKAMKQITKKADKKVMKKIGKAKGDNAKAGKQTMTKAMKKKPAASQSGHPGDAAGWDAFKMVPFMDKDAGEDNGNAYGHLKIKSDLKRAPAVVKYIQSGDVHSVAGCQSVKDFLRSLERKGDPTWVDEWDIADHKSKKLIMERLKMELDEKSVLTITQKASSGSRVESKQIRGWMSLWEVAEVEKIPFKPEYADLLKDLVADDESKPHPNPRMAKKGWRVYLHIKNKAEEETIYHDEGFEARAKNFVDDQDDFKDAMKAIAATGGKQALAKNSGTDSKMQTGAKKWREQATQVLGKLNEAETEAKGFELDIARELENHSNPALQKTHQRLASSWVKKLNTKNQHVVKMKSIASGVRDDIFNKKGNKFETCIDQANDLLKEWSNEDNKGLLVKLLEF